MSAVKPSLALSAEIRSPEGIGQRWDSSADAENRPRDITFSTRRGEGFSNASCTLPRRVDREYVDLGLLDDFSLIGDDGSVAFEGRLASAPRSLSDTHVITPQFVGWMSHAKDRSFTEIYVDRDISMWTAPSLARRYDLLTSSNFGRVEDPEVKTDLGEESAVVTRVAGRPEGSTWPSVSEAWYDAGPENLVSRCFFHPIKTSDLEGIDSDWYMGWASNDVSVFVFNLQGFDPTVESRTAGDAYRYAVVQHRTAGGFPTADDSAREVIIGWRKITVYGDHGLPLIGEEEPKGVAASDAIRHIIQHYCPMLNAGGVMDTTTPIPHLTFRERTAPWDAVLEINKFHLWSVAVWEDKTVHFKPYDYSDYDWEVRLSDPGVTIDLQGDSIEEGGYNGVVVSFDNVETASKEAEVKDQVSPDTHPQQLRDRSPDNPANLHGYERWYEIELSSPTTKDGALYIGQTALVEKNQTKAPGTIVVKGHIRDRRGNWQPVWKVRSGDMIAITDHPNDRPRLIVETDYVHDTFQLTIGVDSEIRRLDAVLDRLANAQVALGTVGR